MQEKRLLALSVQEPWAWLIVNQTGPEPKDVENRPWYTKIRGEIYIHAPKIFDWEGYNWLWKNMPDTAAKVKEHFGINHHGEITITGERFSGIIGKTTIWNCVTEHNSKWFAGPYGFLLKNSHETEFMPCKGQPGFFLPSLKK